MKYMTLTALALCLSLGASAQLNVQLLHQLVEHSKDEYGRQLTSRDRQAGVSATEQLNAMETDRLKKSYRLLHSRFQALDAALQVLQVGAQSAPLIADIIEQQQKIVDLVSRHPQAMQLAIDAERDLSARALQLGRYTAALFVVAGELNQMKSSDRRLLYGHLIAELRVIAGASRGLATTLRYSAMRSSTAQQSPFYDLVNADRRIVDNILRQLEELGR